MTAIAIKRVTRADSSNLDILRRFTEATRAGHPIQTAARMAGIGHTSAWEWKRDGNALLEANPDVPVEELGSLAVFADSVNRAEAEFVESQLQNIHRDANSKGGWAAAMTLLERRRPDDFGRNQRITTESVNINVSVTAELTEAQTTELLAALAERSGQKRELPTVDSPQLEHLLPEATEQT